MAAAWGFALVVLAPWLVGPSTLAPTDLLTEQVPGAPSVERNLAYDQLNDAVYQFLPWEMEVRRAVRAGRLPLWSDLLDGGSSPWVNPQAGVLCPVSNLARLLPVEHFLLATLLLKLVIAFEGTWLLARALGSSRWAALVAGASVAAGGSIMAWGVFPHTRAMAWVPWLVVGTIRLCRRPSPRRVAAVAVITGCLAVAGHPEVALAGGVLAVVCGVALRPRRLPIQRSLLPAAVAAGLGLALAAPHLVPFLATVPGSERAEAALAQVLPDQETSWLRPTSFFLGPGAGDLLASLNPEAFGRPFAEPYTGPSNWCESGAGYAGLLVLAGVAVLLGTGCPRRLLPFAVAAAVCILLSAHFLPTLHVLVLFPPTRAFAYRRLLLLFSLCLCVLGAAGVDRMLRGIRGRWSWVPLALVATLSLLAAPRPRVAALWLLVIAGIAVARRRPRLGFGVLALCLVLDLVPWARLMLPRGDPRLFYPRTAAMERIAEEAPRPGEGRVVGESFTLYPSLLPAYGLADLRPHNPMAPAGQVKALEAGLGWEGGYFRPLARLDHPLVDVLGVRLVVARRELTPPERFQRVDAGDLGEVRLWRNAGALPRCFVSRRVDIVEPDGVPAWLRDLDDPGRVALRSDEVTAGDLRGLDQAAAPPVPVTVLESAPGRLTVEASGPGVLVLSFPSVPGWAIAEHGRPLRRLTVDGFLVGSVLGPGAHRLTLRYRPPGLVSGLVLCGLAAMVVAVCWLRPYGAKALAVARRWSTWSPARRPR